MTAGQLYRLSGLVLLVGAVLSIISSVLSGALFPDSSSPVAASNPLNVALGFIGVIGTMLALLGLPAVYLRRAVEGGLVWLIGVVLIAITGMLFGIFAALTFADRVSSARDAGTRAAGPGSAASLSGRIHRWDVDQCGWGCADGRADANAADLSALVRLAHDC